MKKHSFFAKSLLLTTAMGFFFSPLSLRAQEKVVANLEPKGKWSIRDYRDSQGGANSYCALSRAYDQNLVLSLGRNAIKEYSIAFDFQDRKLNTDKPYAITLQPGPGQIRAYEMMPASPNAMVVRLGYDDSFFDALSQSEFLMADIDGLKYRFALTDMKAGSSQLNDCLSTIRNEKPVRQADNFIAEKVAKLETPSEPVKPTVKKADEKNAQVVPVPKPEKVAEATAIKVVPPTPPSQETLKNVKSESEEIPRAPDFKSVRVAATTKSVESQPQAIVPPSMPSVPPIAVKEEKLVQPAKPEDKVVGVPRVVKQVETAKPDPALIATIEKLQEQNKTLAIALNQEQQKPAKIEIREAPINQTAMQQLEELKEQNKQLAADLAAQKEQAEEKKKLAQELAKAEEEKQKLEQALLEKKKAEDQKRAEEQVKKQRELADISLAKQKAEQERVEEQRRVAEQEKAELKAEAEKLAAHNAEQAKDKAEEKMFQRPSEKDLSQQDQNKQNIAQSRMNEKTAFERRKSTISKQVPSPESTQDSLGKAKVSKSVEERVASQPSVDAQLAQRRALEIREQALKELAKHRAFEEQIMTPSNNTSKEASKADEKIKRVEEENKKIAMDIAEQQDQIEKSKVQSEKIDPMVTQELSNIRDDNQRLEKTLLEQEKKLAAFNDKSPEAEAELKSIRDEIAILRIENRKLYDEAKEARSKIDTVAVQAGEQALEKIREYERKLEAAQRDNLQLAREVETLKVEQENISIGAVSGDSGLESATQRYSEAEREVRRLGLLLEQQRQAHIEEKKKLEGMLFDPALTEQRQRDKLTQLENQLSLAQARLGGAPPIAVSVNDDFPERINVYTNSGAEAVDAQRNNIQASRLREQLDRQEQQLQVYQRQNNSVMAPMPGDQMMAAVPRAPVSAQPLTTANEPYINLPKSIESRPGMVVTATQPSSPLAQDLQNMLNQAGLTLRNGVSQQTDNRYRWAVGNMVGSAEIQSPNQVGNIQNFIQTYISRAQQQCAGEFASLPGVNNNTFEIACISPSRNSAAALYFTTINNDFVAIAHETTADDMDVAMDARDRIADAL